METQEWGKGHIEPFWDNEYKTLSYKLKFIYIQLVIILDFYVI